MRHKEHERFTPCNGRLRIAGLLVSHASTRMADLDLSRPAPPLSRRVPSCSVIIPTFRSGAFIEEAARSVLRQTHSDLELIVIDDGCPEASSARVAALGDRRIVIHRQENRGATAARNAG